jgi:hypothetical protein
MKPIFEKRVGGWVCKRLILSEFSMSRFGVSYPFARILFYKDRLTLKILWRKYTLNYKDIDYIEKSGLIGFGVRVHHHNKKVPKYFFIVAGKQTPGKLFRDIVQVIKENKLNIKIKSS